LVKKLKKKFCGCNGLIEKIGKNFDYADLNKYTITWPKISTRKRSLDL
jgi:hypothetical protein